MLVLGAFLVMTVLANFGRSQINLSVGKPAYQSTQWRDRTPDRAVDGHLETAVFGHHGCTHTEDKNSSQPWLTVDLQGFYYISNITITNRGGCCSDRLNDFKVMIGNTFTPNTTGITEISTWKQCVHFPGPLGNEETRNIQCPEVYSGRFLSIYLDHDGILTLCEVQVFGYPDDYSRLFQEKDENTKITGTILRKMSVKTKIRCAVHCLRDNTCTQFSYHRDVVGNNCVLGSATSADENQDSWVIFST